MSDKLKRVYAEIDEWRTGPLEGEYPYVFVGGVWHKRSWGGSVENVGILVAIGVSKDGHREAVGVAEGMGGGFRQLGTVLSRHDRTRPEGCPARGRRPVRGTGLHGGLDAAEGEGPAAHGAFLAQRALQGAAQPPRMGVGGPEGRVRHGIMRVHVGQGGRRRVRYEGQEAEGGRRLPARGHPRDDHLPAG